MVWLCFGWQSTILFVKLIASRSTHHPSPWHVANHSVIRGFISATETLLAGWNKKLILMNCTNFFLCSFPTIVVVAGWCLSVSHCNWHRRTVFVPFYGWTCVWCDRWLQYSNCCWANFSVIVIKIKLFNVKVSLAHTHTTCFVCLSFDAIAAQFKVKYKNWIEMKWARQEENACT